MRHVVDVKRFILTLLFLFSLVPSHAQAQAISVSRNGSQPPEQGPADNFSGVVRITPLFSAIDPSRVSGGQVTFEPGARTTWHTHPLGQVLIVTAGAGWVQEWGGSIQAIREGDVVRIPPGQKHWHGATATTRLTHIALQEQKDGKAVEWMEKVTEEQYNMAKKTQPAGANEIAREGGVQVVSEDLKKVSPALATFEQDRLYGEVWKRPGLSSRDRSIVTVSAQIARNQNAALPASLDQALNNGVKAGEVSEVITHLAFYSGWANALGAVTAAKDVFAKRGIAAEQLPAASEKTSAAQRGGRSSTRIRGPSEFRRCRAWRRAVHN